MDFGKRTLSPFSEDGRKNIYGRNPYLCSLLDLNVASYQLSLGGWAYIHSPTLVLKLPKGQRHVPVQNGLDKLDSDESRE